MAALTIVFSNRIITARNSFARRFSFFPIEIIITTIIQSGAFNIIVDDTCHCQHSTCTSTYEQMHRYTHYHTTHIRIDIYTYTKKKLLLAVHLAVSSRIRKFILPPDSINSFCFLTVRVVFLVVVFVHELVLFTRHTAQRHCLIVIFCTGSCCCCRPSLFSRHLVASPWLFNFISKLISFIREITTLFKSVRH